MLLHSPRHCRNANVYRGKRVAIIQTGGNIDRAFFATVLSEDDIE